MSKACIDEAALLDLAEGRCPIDASVERHLASCSDCRLVLAAGARGAGDTIRHSHLAAPGEPSWDELGAGVVIADRYVLERFVGAGSMGIVWAARRIDDNEPVALKIARGSDTELFRRFEREAHIIATLDHPNIIRALEIVPAAESRGTVIVMPLLVGESLAERLTRQGLFDLKAAARVIVPVANALGAAHARGIVHRDLKPQNVFLSASRVVVLDFGVAKLLAEWGPHSKLTRTGTAVGTPRYMAPEQIFGEAEVDARADAWALGTLLFHMLAGRPPIAAETVGDIIRALGQGRVDSLSAFVRDVPEPVLDVVGRALEISRDKRLRDVEAFARVLAEYY